MGDATQSTGLFECDACGNVGLGQGEIRCCGRPMRAVEEEDAPFVQPTLEELLRTVFDMSATELDVCLCVMEGGELTAKQLAEQIDYDRSVVARHLNHLVEIGVLEKRRRLLEGGGHVYVYSPVGPDAVRRSFEELFRQWVGQAASLVDGVRREKVEALVEADLGDPQWTIYQRE